MGWTGTYRAKGTTDKEFFEQEFPSAEVVASGRNGSTVYLAARNRADESGAVFGLVILTQVNRDPDYNFYYKDMDETMGPNEAKAPEKVLDALTPTTSEYAIDRKSVV